MAEIAVPEPHSITKNLVMLCEGKADNEFFDRLLESQKIASFDFPFPPDDKKYEGPPLFGLNGFVNMVSRLNTYFDYFAELKTRVRGVLLVADARDNPESTFQCIRRQVESAGKFGVPDAILQSCVAADRPSLAIMLVPGGGAKGCLETLCFEALKEKYTGEATCVEALIDCCSTKLAD